MCRIAGIIDKNKSIDSITKDVKKMCDSMAHGGPDGEGIFKDDLKLIAFGHRRLSLIDLSPTGHQPMFYNQERLVITYNGEIYNYLELKEELIAIGFEFDTQSDTEVILAAFQAWGIDCFQKLEGMFAFALYSKLDDKTFLVRDRAGIKPLYYAHGSNHLIFASEVKAFRVTSYVYTENTDWKIFMLAFGHIPEPYTTFREIEMLPKGKYLTYNHGLSTFDIKAFDTTSVNVKISNKEQASDLINSKLKRAIKNHLLSDAPIGVFLSGGIDSSIVTIVASEMQKSPLNTLSINFDDTQLSEKVYQDVIANLVKTKHSAYLVTKDIFEQLFPMALKAMDQPSSDGINSWFVNYFAKEKGLKAVLSGIGADELFGGYPSFKRMGLINLLSKLPSFILRSSQLAGKNGLNRVYYLSYQNTIGKYLFLRGFFIPSEIANILNIPVQLVNDTLNKLSIQMPNELTNEEQASWLECNLYMQNQLLKDTDSMSMQHGIEVRVPFLDTKLVNTLADIDSDLKYKTSKPKGLLIDAFIDILPKAIWNRKKMGFTFPFQNWLKENKLFLSVLEKSPNLFVQQSTRSYRGGKVHWSKMMALYQVYSFNPNQN